MKSGRSPRVVLQMIPCKSYEQRVPAVSGLPRYLIGFGAVVFEFPGYAGILDRLEFLEWCVRSTMGAVHMTLCRSHSSSAGTFRSTSDVNTRRLRRFSKTAHKGGRRF